MLKSSKGLILTGILTSSILMMLFISLEDSFVINNLNNLFNTQQYSAKL